MGTARYQVALGMRRLRSEDVRGKRKKEKKNKNKNRKVSVLQLRLAGRRR